jgi:hypothetical protein
MFDPRSFFAVPRHAACKGAVVEASMLDFQGPIAYGVVLATVAVPLLVVWWTWKQMANDE